jgi:DNA-binding transcriptional ArsR family regulator
MQAMPGLHSVARELSASAMPSSDSAGASGSAGDSAWQTSRPGRADSTGPAARPRRRAEERQMTKIFKALSDTTRQQILELLEERERNVGEIVCNFNLSQPTISRHLSVLKEADLVVDQRQGQNVIYRLNDETLSNSMLEFFARFATCQAVLR